jgi:hypothetical protein
VPGFSQIAPELESITNQNGREPKAATPRRCSYSITTLFEAMACDSRGTKVEGAAFRQGAMLSGVARHYQYRVALINMDVSETATPLLEPPICALVRRRLRDLLEPADLDLLYLRFCAGWSQAAVAKEWGCFRSTIKRREERILRKVRADLLLREAAGC